MSIHKLANDIWWEMFGKNKTGWVDNNGEVISADELASQTNTLEASDVMRLAKSGKHGLRLLSTNEAKGKLSHIP